MSTDLNVDPQEIAKFEALASRWWDRSGEFKPLHEINPLRANYIDQHSPVAGQRLVDVGCGGGILAEAMAQRGAQVTGIDMGEAPLSVAKLHKLESGVEVDYHQCTAEQLADSLHHEFTVPDGIGAARLSAGRPPCRPRRCRTSCPESRRRS